MKRQRCYCFISFAQNTDSHISGKRRNSTIGQEWEVNYLYNGQLSTFSLYQDCHHIPAAFCLINQDQRISPTRKLGPLSDQEATRSDRHACGKPMLRDHDKQATGNREPANEMNKEDPTQGPFCYSPSQLTLRTWKRSARTFLCKGELRFGKKKNGSTVFMLTSANTKRDLFCRKVWWLDNSRVENPQRRTWISEQSPIRCRGTSSRHSMESISNQNFTGDWEEFTKVL